MEPKPFYETKAPPQNGALPLTTIAMNNEELVERWWLSFTPDHEPTAAAARYIEKVGFPPAYIIKTPSLLLVGPLHSRIRDTQPPAQPANEAAPVVTQPALF